MSSFFHFCAYVLIKLHINARLHGACSKDPKLTYICSNLRRNRYTNASVHQLVFFFIPIYVFPVLGKISMFRCVCVCRYRRQLFLLIRKEYPKNKLVKHFFFKYYIILTDIMSNKFGCF